MAWKHEIAKSGYKVFTNYDTKVNIFEPMLITDAIAEGYVPKQPAMKLINSGYKWTVSITGLSGDRILYRKTFKTKKEADAFVRNRKRRYSGDKKCQLN